MPFNASISSLIEYLNVIKENDLRSCISRGEPKDFDLTSLCASSFRCLFNGTPVDSNRLLNNVNEFYSEICLDILPVQKEHFLAFSQHHGIKTNLLDFSRSPLVSLFFACNSDENESGYVDFARGERLINITGHMSDIHYANQLALFHEFLLIDERYSDIYNMLSFKKSYSGLLADFVQRHIGFLSDFSAEVMLDDFNEFVFYCKAPFMNEGIDHFKQVYSSIMQNDRGGIMLGCAYAFFAIQIASSCLPNDNEDIALLDFPLLFTYFPPVIVDRVRNQSSCLIYQYGDLKYRCLQKIMGDFAIEVSNKKQILDELDQIGINSKVIYNDYDHIAEYIEAHQ